MRSRGEIEEVFADADDWVQIGQTGVRSMTYEEGVSEALRWALGDSEDDIIETKARDEYPDEFE